MARLIVTRGLPASGKTSYARTLQPAVVRVNRDDLRRMLHGDRLYSPRAEAAVSTAQLAAVEALLRAGVDVCVDDTNLRPTTLRQWTRLATRVGATLELRDFTGVEVDECVRRDAARPPHEQVGEGAIRQMHQRHLADPPAGGVVPAAVGRTPRGNVRDQGGQPTERQE